MDRDFVDCADSHRYLSVSATPTFFLIDRNAMLVRQFAGKPDFAALERRIERLLAAG